MSDDHSNEGNKNDRHSHKKATHEKRYKKKEKKRERRKHRLARRDSKEIGKHHSEEKKKGKSKKGNSLIFWIILILIAASFMLFNDILSPYLSQALVMFEDFLSDYEILYSIYTHLRSTIGTASLLGVAYVMFFLSLFFVPAPIEAVFVGFFFLPLNPFLVTAVASLASTFGHLVNFLLGVLFGKKILKGASSGHSRFLEWFSKSGGVILFIINYLPLPSQLPAVGFGLIKYSIKRFFVITLIARTLKFVTLLMIFEYARPLLESIPGII